MKDFTFSLGSDLNISCIRSIINAEKSGNNHKAGDKGAVENTVLAGV